MRIAAIERCRAWPGVAGRGRACQLRLRAPEIAARKMSENTLLLRPRLEEARKALDAALEEACDVDARNGDIAELMRLEEQLTAAREAAANVITALQRLGARAATDDPATDTHRRFLDDRGVQWDAFAVHPAATAGRQTLPAPYDKGWLALQCSDGVRRIAPIPDGWRDCPRDELCRLLETSEMSPRRTG
jgi:hypothetical protein